MTIDSFVNDLMNSDLEELRAAPTKAAFVKPVTAPVKVIRAAGTKPNDRLERFKAQEPGLYEFLVDAGSWSDFARSLASDAAKYGVLTPRQLASARSMQAKVVARQEAKAKPAATVDLAPIRDMFAAAVAKGFKKPSYRAEGLTITLAPAHGANAGALYVKADAAYQGKVVETAFKAVRDALPTTYPALQTIAADPVAAAVRYGRETGCCSFCARELTDARSVTVGYGPICAEKWSLPWGE